MMPDRPAARISNCGAECRLFIAPRAGDEFLLYAVDAAKRRDWKGDFGDAYCSVTNSHPSAP
jgi:hypothetical protein